MMKPGFFIIKNPALTFLALTFFNTWSWMLIFCRNLLRRNCNRFSTSFLESDQFRTHLVPIPQLHISKTIPYRDKPVISTGYSDKPVISTGKYLPSYIIFITKCTVTSSAMDLVQNQCRLGVPHYFVIFWNCGGVMPKCQKSLG